MIPHLNLRHIRISLLILNLFALILTFKVLGFLFSNFYSEIQVLSFHWRHFPLFGRSSRLSFQIQNFRIPHLWLNLLALDRPLCTFLVAFLILSAAATHDSASLLFLAIALRSAHSIYHTILRPIGSLPLPSSLHLWALLVLPGDPPSTRSFGFFDDGRGGCWLRWLRLGGQVLRILHVWNSWSALEWLAWGLCSGPPSWGSGYNLVDLSGHFE